jgi:hypothetical protein
MNVRGVLRSRVRMIRNSFRRPKSARGARGSRRGHPALATGVMLLLAVLFGTGLSALFGSLAAGGAGPADTVPILAVVLTAALTGMLVFDVHHAVASMLLDPDLEWLRRAPLRARAMFGVKLFDSLPRTGALLVVLALPAMLSWADRYPVPAWTFVLWPVWLAALWAIPMGLGTALGMLLLKLVPVHAARPVLGLLSTLTLVLLWMANSFLLPQIVEQGESLAASLEGSGAIAPWLAAISPGHGIALSMSDAATGEARGALIGTLWLGTLGILSLALAALSASVTFGALQGALAAPTGLGRKGRGVSGRRTRRTPAHGPAGVTRAVIVRDLRLFLRDWTVLGDILTAALLWTLLPVLSTRLLTTTPALMVRAMLVALTVGLGYEIAARAVPFERRAIVWARLAPVSPGGWIRAKWLATAVIALPVFLIVTLILAWLVPISATEWVGTLSTGLSALAVALSLGLLTGLYFGDPDWTNPRAMLTVTGRIVATGLLLAQAIGWLTWSALGWLHPQLIGNTMIWVPPVIATAVVLGVGHLSGRRLMASGQPD